MAKKNTTANIIGGSTGGVGLGGGAGSNTGVPSTTSIDGQVIPILDQAGDDPWGLAQLIPQVGRGHAPQSVGSRVASVAKLTLAQQQQLGAILAQAGIIAAKQNYTTTEVQDGLTTAFKLTQESGTGSLSRTLTERSQQGAGTSTTGSTTVEAATRINETTYSPQDIQDVANAAAQKYVGRNATPQEVQSIADVLNQSSASKAQAAAGSEAAAEQQDINAKNAVSGANQGSGDVGSFLAAVKQHESGGSYTANSGDGAYGAYQFIPSTWNSEAKAAGYGKYANGRADQAPPQVQDAVAAYMANNYFTQYGSWEMAARAWYDPAYVNQPNYAPPGNNGLTVGQYGQDIVKLMGQGTPATGGRNPASGVISPVGQGLTQGRTDQGVDYSGKGGLFAVGSGTILSVTNPGWPGGSFVTLKLDNPVDPDHSVVYYAEDITPNVKVGDHVSAGSQIGTATGGGSGIEIGWADPQHLGQALAARSGDFGGDNATPEGQNFLSYISGGANILGAAKSGNTTDIYQQPVITQVPSQESPADAAAYYYQNQDSPDYQKNNLLNVFEMIENNLKTPVPNQKVRGTALSMKPGA